MYIQYIQGLFQSRLSTADYALVTSSLQNNDSLVTWTVIHMTASKFKPLIFSVSGFALSNVSNIFIFMILDDFSLLPAWFCYLIINVRYMKSLMHIAMRFGKLPMVRRTLFCSLCNFIGNILPQIPRQGKHKSLRKLTSFGSFLPYITPRRAK
jgi:hypothetical protein